MVRNVSRNSSKTLFYVGCACVGAYVAYRYWKKRQLKTIDEGFEEVSKIDDTNERRVLLLGLEGAGKTSLMNQAIASNVEGNSYVVPPAPTHGFAVYRLVNGPYTFSVWEIGGADDTRQYWSNFLQDTDLLLFMVDATSDSHKLSLAVSTLKQLLGDPRMDNVPILVIANKQDAPNALRPEEVKEALDLLSISPHKHKVEVIACQTRPLPHFPPGTKEYTWHHPSVAIVEKKIFAMATS
ncbi:ADP-ribosylation factor-like protein 3 [Belonocnema kinseyi]|uniref:ADP-ribosylation factor-like protein 3 n=1 Tax=Belonocnema kinseyi TaxID=2817044 RepID=UPI00143D2E6B|nr:ADP-ribosylation factor-like protein 3 [Belonocnema kinseyi]